MQLSRNDDMSLIFYAIVLKFSFNEMNRSAGDIIESLIGSLTTYLCSFGKNFKDFVVSTCTF